MAFVAFFFFDFVLQDGAILMSAAEGIGESAGGAGKGHGAIVEEKPW
jgi:hypothetical protein